MGDISASLAFLFSFAGVNILLDKHASYHQLSKTGVSLKAKPWVNHNVNALMRECHMLFKRYCNENSSTLKVAKHSKYKNVSFIFIFAMLSTLRVGLFSLQ